MTVHFTRWVLVPAIMVGWLSFSGTASAQANKRSGPARTVEDDGGFFSEKAKQKADEEIAQIKKRFDKDLLIETFSKAPDSISKVNLKDAKEKDEFFLKWAKDRASNADVRGVYVLICKQPSYVRVIEGRRERDSGAFTNDNAKELAKILIGKLKEKKNDEALQEAVAYVHKVFQDHAANTQGSAPARNPAVGPVGQAGNPRGGSSWLGYICLAIFAVLVIWMVVGLIRGFSGAGGGYGGPMGGGGYGYGGGGSIWTSILGGMFGAMAGS